jgi:hypothetical protein
LDELHFIATQLRRIHCLRTVSPDRNTRLVETIFFVSIAVVVVLTGYGIQLSMDSAGSLLPDLSRSVRLTNCSVGGLNALDVFLLHPRHQTA